MEWSSRVREEDGEKVGGVGGKRRQRVERETLEGRGGKRAVLWGGRRFAHIRWQERRRQGIAMAGKRERKAERDEVGR